MPKQAKTEGLDLKKITKALDALEKLLPSEAKSVLKGIRFLAKTRLKPRRMDTKVRSPWVLDQRTKDGEKWLMDNDQLMAVSAHRYCLGRQTYMVGVGIDWLNAHWNELTAHSKNIILRDTFAAIMDHEAGSKYDERDWLFFADSHYAELFPEEQKALRDQLAWKNKPWPEFRMPVSLEPT